MFIAVFSLCQTEITPTVAVQMELESYGKKDNLAALLNIYHYDNRQDKWKRTDAYVAI